MWSSSATAVSIIGGVVCFLSITMASVNHPFGKGLVLLLLSMCVGGCVSVMGSVWMGLVLVVVYCGGMLVLFIYVCCLASLCFFSPMSSWVYLWSFVGWVFIMDSMLNPSHSVVAYGLECMKIGLCDSYYALIPGLGSVLGVVLLGVCKMSQIEKGALRVFSFM